MVEVGQCATKKNIITEKDIELFAQASGDFNPLHLDEQFAEKTIFKKRIAHGMLSASYISAILGTVLPGNGSIYLGQTLNFLKPVYIGDEITTIVTVTEVKNKKVILETKCVNQKEEVVTIGEAKIMLPKDEE